MGFQFSLASVLRVRGIAEEREERILQSILHEIAEARLKLINIDAEMSGSNALRVANRFKQCTAGQIHVAYGAMKELARSREETLAHIEKLEERRDAQTLIYQTARRNREMLTDMKEEKREIYDSDLAKREQSVLDDNHIARRSRV